MALSESFSGAFCSQRGEPEAEAPLASRDPEPLLPSPALEIDARHNADDGGDDALEQLADAFSPILHASRARHAPYRSFVMIALQQWKDPSSPLVKDHVQSTAAAREKSGLQISECGRLADECG